MAATRPPDDRERRLQKAAEFNGRPVLTLVCMGAMMAFGIVPIVLAVRMAWSARHWVATPIEVIETSSRRSYAGDDDRPVDQARGLYRYRFGGLTYTGTRVGVHLQAADDLGGWQRRWAEALAGAHDGSGPALNAWVDPAHPENAVLDPSLRWSLLLFHACFAAVPAWPMFLAARALVARWRLRSAQPR
jgi:Protein of unknown function (DUF3592)